MPEARRERPVEQTMSTPFPSTQERLARYRAWRLREPVDRPMLGLLWEPDIPPLADLLDLAGHGMPVLPHQIRPERSLGYIERWYEQSSELACDLVQRFTPAFGIPWIEAIAGCPVVGAPGSLWAEPVLKDYADRAPIRFDPGNPWLAKLLEFTRTLVTAADGRFPVAVPQFRGPLDTLAAMRTPEQMCVDLLEQPAEAAALLAELAELWIAVGRAVLDVIPPFHGGTMARMGTWTPEKILTAQNDVSTLVSPRLYEQFALPGDRTIVEHFPCTEFHMHGSEHHQVPNLLKLERLTTIQFTLEHTIGGPPLDAMLPVVRNILQQKPLILACLDLQTAERCLAELPAEGLCLTIATNEHEIPEETARWLRRRCT